MDALTLLSYNISFAEPSFVAPNRALRSQEASRLIREECLQSQPDIIALQECPNESWGGSTFGPDYVSIGTQLASHVQEGHIDLLLRRELARHARRITLEHPAFPLPSVAAAITLPNGARIVACSLHLPHSAKGAPARELMCEAIMQIISQQYTNFILIGDFNMRANEDRVVENLAGGGWMDAWKEATGEDKKLKFSWDSRTNMFHEPSPNSFQFIARFDRCYVRGDELAARQFDLIGNQPIDGRKGDYLSDHYGIVVKVDVRPSSSSANNSAKPGVKIASGNKNTNRSNTNDTSMVDLTGDSDGDDGEGGTFSTRKSNENHSGGNSNSKNNVDINTVVRSNVGKINIEEMRRLRSLKFSGCQKSVNGRKTAQPSFVASKPSLPTRNLTAPSSSNESACQSEDVSGDIEPVKPANFTIKSGKPKRYIVYMAIREKKESNFARGLAKCNEACHDEVMHCLQMDGTRHVTMFEGNLTSGQVQNLSFKGHFDPLEMKLDGWQTWDAGCYLKLNKESKDDLQDLLAKIDGLPFGGKRPCDHLSLFRKRPQTKHTNPKREFGKIREATRSHDWGNVEGVSIRIKSFGGPYDECIVLAESRQGGQNSASERDHSLRNNYSQASKSPGNSNNINTKQLPRPTRSKTTDAGISASIQEQELNHKIRHSEEEQYDKWGADPDNDDKMGSEETHHRANGKRVRSATATAAKSIAMNSNKPSHLTTFRGSQKEKSLNATTKKRFKFESSSSDDDLEEMRRLMREKLGKK